MNADDPDSRCVQWTQPARQDMKFLVDRRGFTRDDFRRLVANLERIAALDDVASNPYVCELRMCERVGGQWYRYKAAHLKPSIRVIFEVDDDTLIVWCALERTDATYSIVERRLKEWLRGVLK